jgi:carboxypeptidase family protein
MAAGPPGDLAREIRGHVVDGSGAPVPGALVVIVESSVVMPELALQCDDSGRFAVRVPDGRFTFRAHAPDGRAGDATIELPGDPELRIEVGGGA